MSKHIHTAIGLCCQTDLAAGYQGGDICQVTTSLNHSFFSRRVGLMPVSSGYFEDAYSKHMANTYQLFNKWKTLITLFKMKLCCSCKPVLPGNLISFITPCHMLVVNQDAFLGP